MGKITIKSIAKDLNMSRNTVAMALKNNPKVAESTRERILTYAVSVGYDPSIATGGEFLPALENSGARILILRRPDKTAYWDRVVSGISQSAASKNFIINIDIVTQEDIDALQMPACYSDDLDCVMFLHKFGREYEKMLLSGGKTGIFLDRDGYTRNVPLMGDVIKTEGHRSIYTIVEKLAGQGLKRIAYLCPFSIGAETFDDREIGFRHAMFEMGIPIEPRFFFNHSDTRDKALALETALRRFLPDSVSTETPLVEALSEHKSKLPDAIVCANDDSCIRCARILKSAGIRIPEDIAMTGYDNDEYDSYMPFMTTVESNAFILGVRMVEQFCRRRVHKNAPFETITLESFPIFRRSSEKYL
ncbi:MAG: LacI family DNA-binding transcriptional regulator [Lachnospiraceae bacterium]|nr:LacI family DNA-binding transcriptional regulator [Lachnospiraceae bacterium]